MNFSSRQKLCSKDSSDFFLTKSSVVCFVVGIQMDFLLMLAVQLIIVVLCCIVVQLCIRILDSNMSC